MSDLERKERQWREKEGLLRLTAYWLILAADRSDTHLNVQLDNLRVALRNDPGGQTIRGLVEAISASIARLDKKRKAGASRPEAIVALAAITESLRVPKPLRAKQSAISKRLDETKAGENLRFVSGLITELIHDMLAWEARQAGENMSLGPAPNDDLMAGPKGLEASPDASPGGSVGPPKSGGFDLMVRSFGGFLDRLHLAEEDAGHLADLRGHVARVSDEQELRALQGSVAVLLNELVCGGGGQADDAGQAGGGLWTVGEVLIQLIQRLEFPRELGPQAEFLVERFRLGVDAERIADSIAGVADLAIQARMQVQREKEDVERFLMGLTDQLEALGRYIGSSVESHEQARQRRQRLDATLSDRFDDIAQSVDDATDLDAMKSAIRSQLDGIQEHLVQERRVDETLSGKGQEELTRLKARLQVLETEAGELRERVQKEREQATRDALTGLFNRMAYNERIEQEFARWRRYHRPLSLMVIDVDHFKRVNDTYGHKAGDKVLKLLGELLSHQIREADLVARYGGEEFVVVMPETSCENALSMVEKLRTSVEQCQFHYRGERVPITISCGVTEFRAGDTPGLAFERADKALYKAKHAGRNRCESAPCEGTH